MPPAKRSRRMSLRGLEEMAAYGSTTVEAKSGYGLSFEAEMKSLEAIRLAAQQWPGTVVPTLLGAHVVAPEHRSDPAGYVRIICQDMIPTAAQLKLAEFVDVFCERGAFTTEQTRRILKCATDNNLGVRVHVCQLTPTQLQPLLEFRPASLDHMDYHQRRRHPAAGGARTPSRRCCRRPIISSGSTSFRRRAS